MPEIRTGHVSALILLSLSYQSAIAEEIELDPVTVTARQWLEQSEKVPATVTAIPVTAAQDGSNSGLHVLKRMVPNAQLEQSSVVKRVVIRGATATDTSLQDPVGYFVNDVALPHGAMQAPRLFDLQSMEIIAGPQGSLYGRNTEAGAIKTVTSSPSWTNQVSASLGVYFMDAAGTDIPGYIASSRVSGTVVPDKLAASAALRAETTDGVHVNQQDEREDGGSLENYTLSLGAEYWLNDDTDVTLKSLIDVQALGKQRFRYIDGARETERFVTNYNTDSYDDRLSAIQSLHVRHQLSDMDLVSITGWTRFQRDFQMDPDAWTITAMPSLLTHENDTLSQELRFSSKGPENDVRWLGGLYGFQEWADMDFSFNTPRQTRETEVSRMGVATFGQLEVPLSDHWRIEGGGRVEHIRQRGSQMLTTSTNNSHYGDQDNYTTLLPKLSVSYDATETTMLYSSIARGYLPGGYNYAQAANVDSFTYDPEYSWTAEIGAKFAAQDQRLTASAAVFRTHTTDKQVTDFVVGGNQKISNAGEAVTFGLELNGRAALTEDWSATGAIGLQRAEATSHIATTSSGTVDYSGKRLPFAAEHTYAIGVGYRDMTTEGLFARADLTGTGDYYFNAQNSAKQDAYATVDATLGYRIGQAELAVWARNLFDADYYDRAAETNFGTVVEDGTPRTFGLNLSMKW